MGGGYFVKKEDKINKGMNRGRPGLIKGEKLEKLFLLYYTKPHSIGKLAAIFGVSKTTVLRTIILRGDEFYGKI